MMEGLQPGDLVYHLEDGYASEYKVHRINERSIRVRSTDGTKDFSIKFDEYVEEWNRNLHQLYRDEIERIDERIEELHAPIKEEVDELRKMKRRLLMRLGNPERLSRGHRP